MRHPFFVILWLTLIWIFNKIVDVTPIYIITISIIEIYRWFEGFFVKAIVFWFPSFKTPSSFFDWRLNDEKINCLHGLLSYFVSKTILFKFPYCLDPTFRVNIDVISITFVIVSLKIILLKCSHSSTSISFAKSVSNCLSRMLSSLLMLLFPRSCKLEIDRFSSFDTLYGL